MGRSFYQKNRQANGQNLFTRHEGGHPDRRVRLGTRTPPNPDFGLGQSGQDDHIGNTVHYGEVCEAVRASLAEQNFLLLESLAEHIAKLILDNFGALSVRVKIIKPGILPDVKEVGIEIERSRV